MAVARDDGADSPDPGLRSSARARIICGVDLAGALSDDRPVLIERAQPLSALEAALASVTRTSRGAVAFVAGEAGVGKTELLRRFCDNARRARVVWAACDPLSAPRPLGPL